MPWKGPGPEPGPFFGMGVMNSSVYGTQSHFLDSPEPKLTFRSQHEQF